MKILIEAGSLVVLLAISWVFIAAVELAWRLARRYPRAAYGLVALGLIACTAAQLDNIDPVCIVKDQTCPDARGGQQPLMCGYECCSDHGMGFGSCPSGTSCTNTDTCSGPIPPNDPSAGYGTRKLTRRAGL